MLHENKMSNTYFLNRNKCPSCSSEKIKTIYRRPFNSSPVKEYLEDFYSSPGIFELKYLESANYSLAECQECELIFQQEILNDNLMARLYEKWIHPEARFVTHQKNDDLNSYAGYATEIMQIIAYLDKTPSSLNFFDFGMGWGKWALMAKAFGCKSYGSELSESRIKYAKSNNINAITWDQIHQHQFDFINTEQVFEHIPEPLNTIYHLKKALKVGGLLKISVPTANDIKRRLKVNDWKAPKGSKNSLNPVAPLEHINCFNRKSLLKMTANSDMVEVTIPLKIQYQFMTNFSGIKRILKSAFKPFYLNILKRQNYMFFKKLK